MRDLTAGRAKASTSRSGIGLCPLRTDARRKLTRYLLARREGQERALAGFVQYRFEEEDGRPVLYLYEVQVGFAPLA